MYELVWTRVGLKPEHVRSLQVEATRRWL